ncbi:hypothetical protein MUN82_10030 [Hymenobacter aerilatus]|uniref:XRE family transcriptional regulator n=1 Tax=Hymenobacter aerilatus TaxID=2932251 RepID=A0A8T9T0P3_9BACT|nr:hypothetical protein [Hymenobacter aerilatus]UOR07417.1 hypothetical protein MUN82_10030 [Hymenobacter aerilatus]
MKEEDTINTRLAAFLEKTGQSKFALSKKLGVSASAVGYLVGSSERTSKPSADMLEKLVTACPELNLNWLVAGQGPMLRDTEAAKETQCWALLEAETARRQQLQLDYDDLLSRFQQTQAGK